MTDEPETYISLWIYEGASHGSNRTCNLTLACAITSRDNGYPLHLPIHPISMNETIEGFVEVEQLEAIDLNARNAETVGWVPGDEMGRITGMILACIAWLPSPSFGTEKAGSSDRCNT